MKKYLLPEGGRFYKANLHCHTVLSDAAYTPEQVKALYQRLGYSIVAFTDHDLFIPHPELCDDTFVALNGFEAEFNEQDPVGHPMKTCHVCFIALREDTVLQPCFHRTDYLFGNAPKNISLVRFDPSLPDYERVYSSAGISDMMHRVREAGFFVTYNHPTWSLESYPEYMGYDGMQAMEMFNGSCLVSGFADDNPRVYEDMLRGGKRIYCIGGDDNHNRAPEGSRAFDSGIAFTMIKAEELKYAAVTRALEQGHFYASMGPQIDSLWYEDGVIHITTTSAADRINCSFDERIARTVADESGEGIYEAAFAVPQTYEWLRLTVIDKQGKRACTNAYFHEDLENGSIAMEKPVKCK